MSLSARLAAHRDGERLRLRLGTAFIEPRPDLWPQGDPAATDEWIRSNAFDILAALELALRTGETCAACRIGSIGCSGCSTIWT